MRILGRVVLWSALAAVIPAVPAQTLNLSKDFVDKVKNSATLSINFELDAHLTKPHAVKSGGDDGDIHMAGRAQEVQLPMVVEIMNAAKEPNSVSLIDSSSAGQSIPVVGAWRIWFEHPSQGEQTQGDPVDVPANSNPNHVFEIHPVTSFAGKGIGDSLEPIEGTNGEYAAYSASDAFGHYEKLQATIEVSDTAVSITAKQAGYNYTEFLLEPAGKKADVSDGTFVLANVYDLSEEETPVTAGPRRMVFIAGTTPATEFSKLQPGARMHVLGIPRVNLAEVAAVQPGSAVDLALPYEMIIVAVLPDAGSSAPPPPPATHGGGKSGHGHK